MISRIEARAHVLNRREGRKAFTLIEVLLVAAILSALAGLTLPGFRATQRNLELKETALNLQSLMRYAASRAILEHSEILLIFDDSGPSCRLMQRNPGQERTARDAYQNISGHWGKDFSAPEGIRVHSSLPEVIFFRNGEVDSARICVCNANDCLVLLTQRKTGQIRLFPGEEK